MIQRYTVAEAAKLLECEPETVAERIASGDLPAVKFGRGWIIPAQALDQRLNELALQQAELRRNSRAGKGTSPVPVKQAGPRRARTPPALPSLQ